MWCGVLRTFEAPARHKNEDEVGRKRQRERFSEEQVAAMTQLAERAGWSITAITWEERVKFCDEYSITKVATWLCVLFQVKSNARVCPPCLFSALPHDPMPCAGDACNGMRFFEPAHKWSINRIFSSDGYVAMTAFRCHSTQPARFHIASCACQTWRHLHPLLEHLKTSQNPFLAGEHIVQHAYCVKEPFHRTLCSEQCLKVFFLLVKNFLSLHAHASRTTG